MLRLGVWARHLPFGCWVVASPTAAIAQLGERQTEDLKVPGSIPGLGSFGVACLRCVVLFAVVCLGWFLLRWRDLCLARLGFHDLNILLASWGFSLCALGVWSVAVCCCCCGIAILLVGYVGRST